MYSNTSEGYYNPYYKSVYLCTNVLFLCSPPITEDKLFFASELILFDIDIFPRGSEQLYL